MARNVDPAFDGAIYQLTTAGGIIYNFTYDAYKGTIANNVGTNIPLTFTFFLSVFSGEQGKCFLYQL